MNNEKVTNRHIEICENYARENINITQAKFLLASEGLTDEESEDLIDWYMSVTLNVYDVLFFISLAFVCCMVTSVLTLIVVWINS